MHCRSVLAYYLLLSLTFPYAALATGRNPLLEMPHGVDMAYNVTLLPKPDAAIEVSLLSRASGTGLTTFTFGRPLAGVDDLFDEVRDLQVLDAQGVSLPVVALPGNGWSACIPKGQTYRLSYHLVDRHRPLDERTCNRPIVRNGLVHFAGDVALLYPEHFGGQGEKEIEFAWKQFDPSLWRIHSTLGHNRRTFRVSRSVVGFRHSLFLAGPLRLYERIVLGKPLSVAIVGDDWKFKDAQFVDVVTLLLESHSKVFGFLPASRVLVTLIPLDGTDDGSGGIGLGTTLALHAFRGVSLQNGCQSAMRFKRIISHELFHIWNSEDIAPGLEGNCDSWFSEGFTDFYARRSLLRAALALPDESVNEVNRAKLGYLKSPKKGATRAEIGRLFWKDEEIQRLAYVKGDLIALVVDREIRKKSGGLNNLDSLMCGLSKRAREGQTVSFETIIQSIESFTSYIPHFGRGPLLNFRSPLNSAVRHAPRATGSLGLGAPSTPSIAPSPSIRGV